MTVSYMWQWLQFGEVPLVKAAYRGWAQFVRILIQYGADVNALDMVSQPDLVLLEILSTVTAPQLNIMSVL